jgi:hypothetical protein
MSHVTCDKYQKDAPRLCDSESARMTMPNRVKYEIFGKQVFGASDKKPKNQKTKKPKNQKTKKPKNQKTKKPKNQKTKKPNNSRKILINPEIFMTLDLHKNNGAKHSQTQDICKTLV